MKHHRPAKVRDTLAIRKKVRTHTTTNTTTTNAAKTLLRKVKMSYSRPATHAAPNGRGWYESIPERLRKTIEDCFDQCSYHSDWHPQKRMMALIAPHAGMAYSGRTAGAAFAVFRDYLYAKNSAGAQLERIFILGPCHVKSFDGCELSAASAYETPFGPLRVDVATVDCVIASLTKAGVAAAKASRRVEEAEHSIEMETPYIAHILHYPPRDKAAAAATPAAGRVSIVPIIISQTDRADERAIYEVLKPYMDDARNFFVYSSDFCHWGSRFGYTHHYKATEYPNIGDAIIAMDHAAMDLLEHRNVAGWYTYLKTTRNTICGRAPISVGLQHWAAEGSKADVKFVHYSQSSKCQDVDDSSVSYAGAVVVE